MSPTLTDVTNLLSGTSDPQEILWRTGTVALNRSSCFFLLKRNVKIMCLFLNPLWSSSTRTVQFVIRVETDWSPETFEQAWYLDEPQSAFLFFQTITKDIFVFQMQYSSYRYHSLHRQIPVSQHRLANFSSIMSAPWSVARNKYKGYFIDPQEEVTGTYLAV